METELAKYEEKITQKGAYKEIDKYSNGELIESRREFYVVYLIDKEIYKISDEQYENLKELLNTNIKFIEIGKDLVAVHQITKIEKRSERTFGRD
jgi:hypothetical protein